MRAVVAFVVSFAFVVTVGVLMLPDMAPRPQAQVVASFEIVPNPISLVVPRLDDASQQHAEAWRLLKARQYPAAEDAYLQILVRNPHDGQAQAGLVTLRRLQANQDPQTLREQAAAYRRAIVEGRGTDEKSSPRKLELLAEACLSAASEITTEQNLRVAVSSKVSIGSTLAHPTLSPHGNMKRNPLIAINERIHQMAFGERPRPSSQQRDAIATPAAASQPPSRRIALARGNRPTSAIGGPPDPVAQRTPDSRPQPPLDSTQPGPAGTVLADTYVLGSGDQIEVNVPDLIITVTIRPDGMIALPLINQVKAAGKTAAQLEFTLTRMYSTYLKAPSITVLVRQFRTNSP